MKLKQKNTFTIVFAVMACCLLTLFLSPNTLAQSTEECVPGDAHFDTCIQQQEKDRCDPEKETCCGDVKTSILKGDFCDEKGEGGVIFGLLKWVLRIMTAGVGIAAVGGVAWGALLYTTAENKPEKTKKAIGVITNVVIGIAAYAFMYALLNFIIPGGVFG